MQRDIDEYKEKQRVMEKQTLYDQHEQTIQKHIKQWTTVGQIPDEYKAHVPKTELPKRAVAETLDNYNMVKLNFENSYVAQPPMEPKLQMISYLT